MSINLFYRSLNQFKLNLNSENEAQHNEIIKWAIPIYHFQKISLYRRFKFSLNHMITSNNGVIS